MKIKLMALSFIGLLLVGCSQKVSEIEKVPEKPKQEIITTEEEVIKTLSVDLATFHFVVDWLTDTKIVYVEKDATSYYVKTFDILSGETDTLHKESKIIVDVILHPTKNTFLLHTTDNPSSATIKIISLEGVILDEVSIASSELAIEWNDLDPKLILLTAFYQDWTYDIFFYNGNNQELKVITLDDPFPKWRGTEKIITLLIPEHPLDGGHLTVYDLISGRNELTDLSEVIHFDTNKESLLVVQIDDSNAVYKIMDSAGTVLEEWKIPAVSNYSEWVIPEFSWSESATVLTAFTGESGQLDNLKEPFGLARIEDGEPQIVVGNLPPGKLLCSPNGQRCLVGYSAEEMIDLTREEIVTWLVFSE